MRTLGMAAGIVVMLTAAAMVLAAIWTPYHWQWSLTALVALIVGLIVYSVSMPPSGKPGRGERG